MRSALRLGMLGLAALTAACSNDMAAPNGTGTVNADVATFTADAVGQDIELMHGPGGRFGFGFGDAPGSFQCTSATRDGLTIDRSCTYYDAGGTQQDAYDSLTTASVTVHVNVSGSVSRDEWGSASVNRVRDITVTGLEGVETSRTWNGTGTATVSRIHTTQDSNTVQIDMTSTETATNVVLPVPRTATSWPLSGTITSTVTLTFTGGPHDGETMTRDVTVTFDGTQYATVTVNGETFTVDLASRRCTGGGDGQHRDGGGMGDRQGH